MKKLSVALAFIGGLAMPYAAYAADSDVPAEIMPPATQKAPTAAPGAEGRAASSMFDRLDGNKDGFVDSSEIKRSATAKTNRKAMDVDGDGKISRSEWEAFEAGGSRGPD